MTPQNMLPLSMKASPPNIFFSVTVGRTLAIARTRLASSSEYAILVLASGRLADLLLELSGIARRCVVLPFDLEPF